MANNDKYIESNNEKYIEGNNEKYIATASRAMKQQEAKSFVWRESAACFCWPGYDDDCDDVDGENDGADDDDEDGDNDNDEKSFACFCPPDYEADGDLPDSWKLPASSHDIWFGRLSYFNFGVSDMNRFAVQEFLFANSIYFDFSNQIKLPICCNARVIKFSRAFSPYNHPPTMHYAFNA